MPLFSWIIYLAVWVTFPPQFSLGQLQGMVGEQRMRPKWKEYCTFNNALRCHPTIVAQSSYGLDGQGWKIYKAPRTKDYYVGITCPQQCWQSIRVYSDMQSAVGIATLSFYYYMWETQERSNDGLLPELRIKGCANKEVWRSANQPQSQETGEWIGVVLHVHCIDTFSIIFEGIMTSGGQVIAVDNVVLSEGRSFNNVLQQPSISVVHPTLAVPGQRPPVQPTRGTIPAGGPTIGTQRTTLMVAGPGVHSPQPAPTHKAWATHKTAVPPASNGTFEVVPSTKLDGGPMGNTRGNSTTIPKLLVALAVCICAVTICIHCIIYRRQKKCHQMKQGNTTSQDVPQNNTHGQLSSCSSVCEIVITDHSRNSWAVNQLDDPNRPSTSRGLTATGPFGFIKRPRLATCTIGAKHISGDMKGRSELRPSGRACSLPSRPTPNIYESIDEVRNGLASHPSNFFLNLSKRSPFVKKMVDTFEMPFKKNPLDKRRASFLFSKERSSSDSKVKCETGNYFKIPFRKSNSHSGGVRLNRDGDVHNPILQDQNTLSPTSPTLPKRPFSNVFTKQTRKDSFRSSKRKSRSQSDLNADAKRESSFVSPYSCSKLPNISLESDESKPPNVHFGKFPRGPSPNQSMAEVHNETTVSSRLSEHLYQDLDNQGRPSVTPNLYHVLNPKTIESSSSDDEECDRRRRAKGKRNTVLRRTESGYTVVSKSSCNSDFEHSTNSSLSNVNNADRVYFRLESMENSQEDFEYEFGVRDGLLEHEFELSCDVHERARKLSRRRGSDLETTCTLSMYEESGRLLDETDVSIAVDDRPDVLKDVKA